MNESGKIAFMNESGKIAGLQKTIITRLVLFIKEWLDAS